MNILLISEIYLPTVSGVASSTDSIARFMASRGHHVYLICPKPIVPYVAPPQENLEIIYTPRLRDPFFVGKSMAIIPLGLPEIWRTIRNSHIDVVHIQEPGALGIMALTLSRLYGLPVVGAMHFSLEQVIRITPWFVRPFSAVFTKLYIRAVYPQYTAIMMPTKTVISELSSLIGHAERIHPISNGVETTIYTPVNGPYAKLRKKYGFHETEPYFMYLGRLDADKNIETMIRALAVTPNSFHMIIAGVGKQAMRLLSLAKELSVNDRIIWLEKIAREEIVELYQLSDVFVITSPVETQSIVALQAIACGLPVLAANAGALPELVHDGENGYLLPTFDEKLLAEKMCYLATHPEVRSKMGAKSRELSMEHEKSRVLKKLEALYTEVIRDSRSK